MADKAFLQALQRGGVKAEMVARKVQFYIGDRPLAFVADGVQGDVEPVQPRVTQAAPLTMLCLMSGPSC